MSYTLALSNGKVFTGLAISGTCFVSNSPVYEADFTGGMNRVVLSGTPDNEFAAAPYETGELPLARFGRVFQADGKYYFYFETVSPEELERESARADIDYLAMMMEVEL